MYTIVSLTISIYLCLYISSLVLVLYGYKHWRQDKLKWLQEFEENEIGPSFMLFDPILIMILAAKGIWYATAGAVFLLVAAFIHWVLAKRQNISLFQAFWKLAVGGASVILLLIGFSYYDKIPESWLPILVGCVFVPWLYGMLYLTSEVRVMEIKRLALRHNQQENESKV